MTVSCLERSLLRLLVFINIHIHHLVDPGPRGPGVSWEDTPILALICENNTGVCNV